MSLINEAYDILSDPKKRENFDADWGIFQASDVDHEPHFEAAGIIMAGNIPTLMLIKCSTILKNILTVKRKMATSAGSKDRARNNFHFWRDPNVDVVVNARKLS